MVLFCGFILVLVLAGVCPPRQLPATTTQDWVQLANIFETLHGGPAVCQHAASYLRGLAAGTLPQNELIPLEWHGRSDLEVLPQARAEPHACVLAVMCPSVPLRAVWRRGR